MKSSWAFGIGMVSGVVIAAALLWVFSSRDSQLNEAEIARLRENLTRMEKAVRRDQETSRVALKQRQEPNDAFQSKPGFAVPAHAPGVPSQSPLAAYLGSPVAAPANLDRKYSPEEISAVFRDLAETLGFKVDELGVDTSEFPYVIHGRVESTAGANFFKKIDSELRALPDYTYGGSVTGGTKEGSTYFALNITPDSAYPRDQAETIRRRLLLRLQMVATARGNSSP